MKKLFIIPALAATLFVGQAQAADFTIVTAAGTIAVVQLPTALLAGSTAMSFAGPHKENVIKMAAVEAAEFVAGGEMGPVLGAIVEANQDRSEDEIVDLVLEAASQF